MLLYLSASHHVVHRRPIATGTARCVDAVAQPGSLAAIFPGAVGIAPTSEIETAFEDQTPQNRAATDVTARLHLVASDGSSVYAATQQAATAHAHRRKRHMRHFWRLWAYVESWSSTRVYVNGKEIQKWNVFPYSAKMR